MHFIYNLYNTLRLEKSGRGIWYILEEYFSLLNDSATKEREWVWCGRERSLQLYIYVVLCLSLAAYPHSGMLGLLFSWTVGEAGPCCFHVWSHHSVQCRHTKTKGGQDYPQAPHWRMPGKLQHRNFKNLLISDDEVYRVSYKSKLCPSPYVPYAKRLLGGLK